MKRLAAVALLGALVFSVPALAQQQAPAAAPRAQQLDQLFVQLKSARSEAAASDIEDQIVGIWLEFGDPKIDQQMSMAIDAMDSNAFDVALNTLNAIIKARPDYVEGWNKRATLYYLIGHYQDSLNDIAQTLMLEPRHFGAITGLGMVELDLGDDQKALTAFQKALALDPQLSNIQAAVKYLEGELGGQHI